mgnify:CR=1 FL=1
MLHSYSRLRRSVALRSLCIVFDIYELLGYMLVLEVFADGPTLTPTTAGNLLIGLYYNIHVSHTHSWRLQDFSSELVHEKDVVCMWGFVCDISVKVVSRLYVALTENKRKGEQVFDSAGTTAAKMKRPASEMASSQPILQKTSDLVILGLAYTAEESDLKEYFEEFGEVLMTQVETRVAHCHSLSRLSLINIIIWI